MSQADSYTMERRTWWERLFGSLMSRAEADMNIELPADSLFAQSWGGANSVADVPDHVKAQIREEALLTAFNRLEGSLRLLLYATTPGKEPPTAERCHQILNVWRYELEHRVHLTPDTYCGAVQRYEPEMESAYTINGRCVDGDLLRIRVPCWRMGSKIVIRGEAELMDSEAELVDGGAAPAARPEPVAAAALVEAMESENATVVKAEAKPEVKAEAPAAVLAEAVAAEPMPVPEPVVAPAPAGDKKLVDVVADAEKAQLAAIVAAVIQREEASSGEKSA